MDLIQSLDSLDFNQQVSLHKNICDIVADDCPTIGNLDGLLLVNHESYLAELMRKGVFIDLLEKSDTQAVADRKRRFNHLVG